MLGAGALGRPRGMVWGGRKEEGSGWGTHVYLWQIHFDIWQNKYNIVKFKKKKKVSSLVNEWGFGQSDRLREGMDTTLYPQTLPYASLLSCVISFHNKW